MVITTGTTSVRTIATLATIVSFAMFCAIVMSFATVIMPTFATIMASVRPMVSTVQTNAKIWSTCDRTIHRSLVGIDGAESHHVCLLTRDGSRVWRERPINTPPVCGTWGRGTVTTCERTEMASFLRHFRAQAHGQTFFARSHMRVRRNWNVLTDHLLVVIVVVVVVVVVVGTIIVATLVGTVTNSPANVTPTPARTLIPMTASIAPLSGCIQTQFVVVQPLARLAVDLAVHTMFAIAVIVMMTIFVMASMVEHMLELANNPPQLL